MPVWCLLFASYHSRLFGGSYFIYFCLNFARGGPWLAGGLVMVKALVFHSLSIFPL